MPFGFLPVVGAAPCGRPNAATEMAEHWLLKLEEKFPCVAIDKYVIMPNHIHVMISIGAQGGHIGPPLPKVVDWYKTMTTNEYIRLVRSGCATPFEGRLWQRSYYDHIIRSYDDYLKIWHYIDSNPAKWQEDEYYDGTSSMPITTKES